MKATPDQVRDALREAGRGALVSGRPGLAHTFRKLAHHIDDASADHLRRLLR